MPEPTPSRERPLFGRENLIHAGQLLAAAIIAGLLTVVAIAQGWLPLCARAAGLTALAIGVVIIAALEFVRRRPWRR